MLVVDHQYTGLDRPSGPLSVCTAPVDMQEGRGRGQDITNLDSVVKNQVDKAPEAKATTQKSSTAAGVVKKRFQSELRTIRESPEIVYTVSYIDMDQVADEIEQEGIIVPEPEPATPGVTVVEIAQDDPNVENIGACSSNYILTNCNKVHSVPSYKKLSHKKH